MILSHYDRAVLRDAVLRSHRQIRRRPFASTHHRGPAVLRLAPPGRVEPFSIPLVSYIGDPTRLSFVDSACYEPIQQKIIMKKNCKKGGKEIQ